MKDNILVDQCKANITKGILTSFHSEEYIEVLQKATPENILKYEETFNRFGLNGDCPIMENLYDYIISYTSGSMGIKICYIC